MPLPEAAALVVSTAKKEVGTKESPANSNNVKYNTWYYGKSVSGSAYPWCMVFCLWVYNQTGCCILPGRSASCTQMMTDATKTKQFIKNYFQPGDLILLDFTGVGTPQHCGILESVSGKNIQTIEGNTGTGNDANGGQVMVRTRPLSQVVGAVRPIYKEVGLDMTVDEFISKLTDEQAYNLMTKAASYAAKVKEPSWSTKEGHWKTATAKKIVDGTAPEGYAKRDEIVAILGRLNLL